VIEVRNLSTVLTDAEVKAALGCFQAQIDGLFRQAWQRTASLSWRDKSAAHTSGNWRVDLLDDSDQAGALGYHDDVKDVISGSVFAKTDLDNGYEWTITFSHETLEMLVDPTANLGAQVGTRWYALEVGDPVEADALGYSVTHAGHSIQVSDFVLPDWFIPGSAGPFDARGHLTAPLQLTHGGYLSYWESGQWHSREMSQEGTIVPKALDPDDPRFASRVSASL
jgi:hypothetical protein